MRLLLDTHVLLWTLGGSPRIEPLRERILSTETEVFISVASLWEIAIKSGLGRLETNVSDIRKAIEDSGFVELPVMGHHTEQLARLALLHRDPFDRLLVAQAISEPMHLLTADKILLDYSELVELVP